MKGLLFLAVGVSASTLKTAPIDAVQAEAKREDKENVQIHDYWSSLEAQDAKKEKAIKHNRNLMMLQLSAKTQKRTAPLDKIAAQVKSDFQNRVHISDAFSTEEKKDIKAEKAIKANKNMRAFLQLKTKSNTAPIDQVAAAVARDTRDNIQIHDTFAKQEKDSKKEEKDVKIMTKSFLQAGEREGDAKPKPTVALGLVSKKGAGYNFNWDKDDGANDDGDKTQNAMDKYVTEFEKKENKDAVHPDDFSQSVNHSYTSSGNIISIPLSSQLQTQMK